MSDVADPADVRGMADLDVAGFLADHPPFDSLGRAELGRIAAGARQAGFGRGQLILDAFTDPTLEVFVVVSGRVALWNNAEGGFGGAADEFVEPGGLFGFSAMLTERSIGPRAVAVDDVTVLRIGAEVVAPAFTSKRGARFLAERVFVAGRRPVVTPTYSTVDELIQRPPLLVGPETTAQDVARSMSERGSPYAAVRQPGGGFGLVTDATLRQRILVDGLPPTTPVRLVMEPSAPTAVLGDSASEALILMLEQDRDYLLVADRAGDLRGVIAPRDFAVSPTSATVSLHEQLRRASTTDELQTTARKVPGMLADLLASGLASGKVVAAYSSVLDSIVRRAIALVFASRPELSVDAFTWLSLGSNGRREAVLSSDVDSAAAFDDAVRPEEIALYREAFAAVDALLARAGLSGDTHGASAQQRLFARTNTEWRAAGRQWLATPVDNNGAMMTSLLVDGRPIHGDPGLPAVSGVFADLRSHPGTMRLLLQESLATRARLHSVLDVFTRRADTFDIKDHAVIPVVNIGRWAALSVGSSVLPTTERLRAAAGSAMLPDAHARTLIEVFEVLQRLRLRYQLMQHAAGDRPSDVLTVQRLSPIDRSVLTQAVREIAATQKRMANVAAYVTPAGWTKPEPH